MRAITTRINLVGVLMLTVVGLMLGPNHVSAAVVSDHTSKKEFKERVSSLLRANDFASLELIVDEIRESQERFSGGDWKLQFFYSGIDDVYERMSMSALESREKIFKAWLEAYPKSVAAHVAYATYLKDLAWRHRGSGYADTVTEEGARKFYLFLKMANQTLQNAEGLDQKDPHLYAIWINVANGLGLPKFEIYSILNRGKQVSRDYGQLYTRMATVVLPRWRGRPGELKAFIETIAEETRESNGAEFYFRLAYHVQGYVGAETYRKFGLSWTAVQDGAETLLQKYPEDAKILHQYAQMAIVNKDQALAAKLFERIGNHWDGVARNVWGNRRHYNQSRRDILE